MRDIGVDLHKTNFVACFLAADDTQSIETYPLTRDGLAGFKRRLRKGDELAVEATQNVHYFYDQVRAHVARVVVVDIYRFGVIAKSKKKTDKADAAALARLLKLGWLPEVPVPSEQVRTLRQLLQVHGLNLLSAISLLAEVGDIALFDTSKQLVSYAGLATSTKQSSETTRHGGITKRGRKRLRTVCIQVVLAMVNRTDTPLMSFYQKKKREKGAGKAICATARKLLTVIFVLLKKELDYWYFEDRLYNRKLRALDAAA